MLGIYDDPCIDDGMMTLGCSTCLFCGQIVAGCMVELYGDSPGIDPYAMHVSIWRKQEPTSRDFHPSSICHPLLGNYYASTTLLALGSSNDGKGTLILISYLL